MPMETMPAHAGPWPHRVTDGPRVPPLQIPSLEGQMDMSPHKFSPTSLQGK